MESKPTCDLPFRSAGNDEEVAEPVATEEEPDFVTLYPNSKPARVQKLARVHEILDVDVDVDAGFAYAEDIVTLDTFDAEKNEAVQEWLAQTGPKVSRDEFGEYFHRALPNNAVAFDGVVKNFTQIAEEVQRRIYRACSQSVT